MGVSDLIGAKDQLRAALVSRPNSSAILYQCAVVSFNLGENLSARAFLERYFGTSTASADSLLLAVRNEQKLRAKDLVVQYASKLRSDYPASEQTEELRAIMVSESND
jgi:type IV pilus assembly protein PilF